MAKRRDTRQGHTEARIKGERGCELQVVGLWSEGVGSCWPMRRSVQDEGLAEMRPHLAFWHARVRQQQRISMVRAQCRRRDVAQEVGCRS